MLNQGRIGTRSLKKASTRSLRSFQRLLEMEKEAVRTFGRYSQTKEKQNISVPPETET